MIAYLDTHACLWLVQKKTGAFSPQAIDVMESCDLLISPIVTVELAYLNEIGRITLNSEQIRLKLKAEVGLELCNLPFGAVAYAATHENWTRDVFDRVIVAQARTNREAMLISTDEKIQKHYTRAIG